jgi:deoxyribonuclease-4
MSIAGGVHRAVERAADVGCRALQIFNKSSNQWRARPLAPDEVRRFRAGLVEHRIDAVVAHNSYLINLASPDDALWERSIAAMVLEMERCEALGIPGLVAHPGAHVGSGVEEGIRRIARGLDVVHRRTAGLAVRVLLETTAGQGTTLGRSFQELGEILARLQEPERVGICFDTCHVFAAGYDLVTRAGWQATWEEFAQYIGLDRLAAFHVNDSKGERGSRLDRHRSLGDGAMGLAPFLFLVNDPRLRGVPMVLETPKLGDGAEDRRNLETLRDLVGRRRVPSRRRAAVEGGVT